MVAIAARSVNQRLKHCGIMMASVVMPSTPETAAPYEFRHSVTLFRASGINLSTLLG
jgi:hypothetical protein